MVRLDYLDKLVNEKNINSDTDSTSDTSDLEMEKATCQVDDNADDDDQAFDKNQVSRLIKNFDNNDIQEKIRENLHECYEEVNRRAESLNCKDFNCTFDRFRELAQENGEIELRGIREAISVLQLEMEGVIKNARRVDYGKGVAGLDYRVDGVGKYAHITHLDIKNPVGSEIEKASRGSTNLVAQGERIGAKGVKQQNNWSNSTFREALSKTTGINLNADFPKTNETVLIVVDGFDVPRKEKPIIRESVKNGSNDNPNLLFINMENNV